LTSVNLTIINAVSPLLVSHDDDGQRAFALDDHEPGYARSLLMKTPALLILSLALSTASAWAAAPSTDKGDPLKLKGDAKNGEEVYEVCSGCHLASGLGRSDGTLPVVSGQHANVLVKQMVDIRTGHRDNPTMLPFSQSMTAREMADAAAYMHTLKLLSKNGKGTGKNVKRGKELYDKDCKTCHGANGEGDEAKFVPMLTGQHFKYMQRQLDEMRAGKRKNADKDMLKVIKPYSDADIEAVSDFMSRLPIKAAKK
jgi:cytochrome c553